MLNLYKEIVQLLTYISELFQFAVSLCPESLRLTFVLFLIFTQVGLSIGIKKAKFLAPKTKSLIQRFVAYPATCKFPFLKLDHAFEKL